MRHTFDCIDAHTCGNPVRVVRSGGPGLTGANMREKRQQFLASFDWIRKGLMFEPRGHDMMSGSIIYPPHEPGNDAAILFIETSGCLPMCGHGMIGTVTVAIEEGLIHPKTPGMVRLETPAGLVTASYVSEKGKVRSVRLTNIPSYLHIEKMEVECPGLGLLEIDIAYGGNFYAIVDMQENYPGLDDFDSLQLIGWSRVLRERINGIADIVHPEDPTIRNCTHILWTGKPLDSGSTARNAVFYGDKAIDRSPCGTGTSARMAQWFTRGRLKKGESFLHESIIGSKFVGRIEAICEVAGKTAIQPSIEGWARIYGHNQIIIDQEDDPYAYGFQVL